MMQFFLYDNSERYPNTNNFFMTVTSMRFDVETWKYILSTICLQFIERKTGGTKALKLKYRESLL